MMLPPISVPRYFIYTRCTLGVVCLLLYPLPGKVSHQLHIPSTCSLSNTGLIHLQILFSNSTLQILTAWLTGSSLFYRSLPYRPLTGACNRLNTSLSLFDSFGSLFGPCSPVKLAAIPHTYLLMPYSLYRPTQHLDG